MLLNSMIPGTYELKVTPTWLTNRVRDYTLKVTANHDVNLIPKPASASNDPQIELAGYLK